MALVTITQQNQNEHIVLLDEFKALQKEHHNPSGVNIDHALMKGEKVLLLVDHAKHVQAGAMLRMEQPHSIGNERGKGASFASKLANRDSLKDGKSLPSDAGNVGFVYGLVASKHTHGLMPGLQLQKAINQEFAAKQGIFANIDILAADVVERNLLLWCEGVEEAHLHAVMRPDLTKGGGSNRAIFVAAAADPTIQLVPERYADKAFSGDAMREKAYDFLKSVKEHYPSAAAKKRVNKDRANRNLS